MVVHPRPALGEHRCGSAINQRFQDRQLFAGCHQRHHHFGHWRFTSGRNIAGRFKDRAGLHFVNFREGNPQPAAPVTQHRIEFVQFIRAAFERGDPDPDDFGQLLKLCVGVRQEFVQRRIEQADRHRQPGHRLKNAVKIGALFGQQLGQCGAAPGLVFGQDHLAHGGDPPGIEEHMLGPAQPDALRAELPRGAAIGRGFGVGPHFHPAVLIGPSHQHPEIADQFRLDRRHVPGHHLARGAIKRDLIALFELARANPQCPAGHVDRHG